MDETSRLDDESREQFEARLQEAADALWAIAKLDQKIVLQVGVMLYMRAEWAVEGNERTEQQIKSAVCPLGDAHRKIKCWMEAIRLRCEQNDLERG